MRKQGLLTGGMDASAVADTSTGADTSVAVDASHEVVLQGLPQAQVLPQLQIEPQDNVAGDDLAEDEEVDGTVGLEYSLVPEDDEILSEPISDKVGTTCNAGVAMHPVSPTHHATVPTMLHHGLLRWNGMNRQPKGTEDAVAAVSFKRNLAWLCHS